MNIDRSVGRRSVISAAAIVMLAGCIGTKKVVRVNKLNGSWVPVLQEMGGAPVPRDFMASMTLEIADSNYTVISESVDKGVIRYHGAKMDIYGRDGINAGKHFTAIYKFDDSDLTICYNLKGDVYPGVFDTKGSTTLFLSVFRRAEKK